MKTRNCFVSNSSSSSFVVVSPTSIFVTKGTKTITEKQVEKLRKYGFKNGLERYTYSVSCNQQDVIDFLTKNKIPFKAEEHYNHYCIIYNGGDYYYRIVNLGNILSMYGTDNLEKEFAEQMLGQPLIDKVLIKSVSDSFKKKIAKRKVKVNNENS